MTVLVTGGAGYIGSHTCVQLLEAGHDVVVVDDLSNSCPEALYRVERIAGRPVTFHEGSILDGPFLGGVFGRHTIDAVVHFAAFKSVGDSVKSPLSYYWNNVAGTVVLCQAMERAGVRRLIFSSSATVYGETSLPPFDESLPTSATNPYGWTKVMMEQVLKDLAASDPRWAITLLRYFNPVGAHPSGLMGEDPQGVPANLVPFVAQVAVGRRPAVKVFGRDYPTPDGTGTRDYIHVVDLAAGHLAALAALGSGGGGVETYNLGTGRPYSVLEVIRAFEGASGRSIPFEFVPRRPGDVAASFANPEKARRELGWAAGLGLEAMTRDAWNWQQKNPGGYRSEE